MPAKVRARLRRPADPDARDAVTAPNADSTKPPTLSRQGLRYYQAARDRVRRDAVAGTLTLSSPQPVVTVQVDEFFNVQLQRHFITASAAEKQDLDTGIHTGWTRTGESFQAYATGSSASGSINPACRYYGNPLRDLDSQFYSADAGECAQVGMAYSDYWLLESGNVFQINLPNVVTGACPTGTIPVYRLWNQRADSNHRYTTRATIKEQIRAAGYVAEGYGPGGVAMCAVE